MKLQHSLLLTLPLASSYAIASELTVKFEIPALNVAEYHRPYVAMWIERADQSVVSTLSVQYEVKKKDNGGAKWLKDLRQFWRKAGRDLQMPMDGVSGATRATGEQSLTFASARHQLDKSGAGDYQLVIEAARESGGRELVRVPFQWPQKSAQKLSAHGKEELGAVTLQITP